MKTIEIRAIPNAKKNHVKLESGVFRVYLTTPPVDGRANKAIIKIMADFFNVRKNQIEIIKGLKSRDKTIRIL